MDLYTFLKRLPKVSLHVHLAGSVQPSTLVELASKNGVALPAYREPEDLYDYPDISQFLKIFDRVIASVQDRADFHRITYETLQQAAEHGVRHREMFWNPTLPHGMRCTIRDGRGRDHRRHPRRPHRLRHPVLPDR